MSPLVKKSFLLPALMALCAGCSSVYHMQVDNSSAMLSSQDRGALTKKKFAVPCRVEVICPGDMVGKYDTFFTGNLCHYPLETIIERVFSDAVYAAFEQPGGEVLDSFTMKVEVFKSELKMDSSEAVYNLSLNITFEEPGEKKLTTFTIEKHVAAPVGENPAAMVPEAIYKAIREAAMDSIAKMKLDPKVVKTVRRFERK
jgi:hypothetical protein